MDLNKSIPKIADCTEYIKQVEALLKIRDIGYLDVEITDNTILNNLKIPEGIYKLCSELNISVSQCINMILRDFLIRFTYGNNIFEKNILKKIRKAPRSVLSDYGRLKLLKYLLEND